MSPLPTLQMRPLILSLEGNIGAGKSTILAALRSAHPEWIFVDEPVDQWMALKNNDGLSLLELFYEDKKRWAYTFQNAAILTRALALQKVLQDPDRKTNVIIMERSLETDSNVFAKMLEESGDLDHSLESSLYKNWYSFVRQSLPPTTAHIWVNLPPEVCLQRTRGRGREGEDDIPLSYFEALHKAHERWLSGASAPAYEVTTFEEAEKSILTLVREANGGQ